MKCLGRLGNLLSYLFILVLLATVLMTAVPKLLRVELFAVQTGSMQPALPIGTLVYAVPASFEEINEGDIITYVLNEQLTVVTHRVVEIDKVNKRFYTKGDANQAQDGAPVENKNVIGVVKFSIPVAGKVIMALEHGVYRIIAVAAVTACIIIMLLQSLHLKKKNDIEAASLDAFAFRIRKIKRRQRMVKLSCFTAVLFLGAGMALAMRQKLADDKVNEFHIGDNNIEIAEPGVDPDAAEWGANAKPVCLKNNGNTDSVVRVMILPLFINKETDTLTGGSLSVESAPTGQVISTGDFTLHFQDDFTDGESSSWKFNEADGYFYYKKVLPPGAETTQLLSGITLLNDEDAEKYQEIRVELQVLADSIQAGGKAPREWGISVMDNGSDLVFEW